MVAVAFVLAANQDVGAVVELEPKPTYAVEPCGVTLVVRFWARPLYVRVAELILTVALASSFL